MNLVANFAVLASRRMIFDLPVCDLNWEDALTFINELASLAGRPDRHLLRQRPQHAAYAARRRLSRRTDAQNLVLPDGVGLDISLAGCPWRLLSGQS